MINKYSLLLLIIFFSGCSVREEGPCEIVYTNKRVSPYYTVKDGDTVESISLQYHMKERDLISINKLHPPYNLLAGQRLLIYPKGRGIQDKQKDVEVKPLDEPVVDAPPAANNPDLPDNMQLNPDAPKPQNDLFSGNQINSLASPAAPVVSANTGLQWPVKGKIIQTFDGSSSKGINILAPKGTPVNAIADGVVKFSGTLSGYGKIVIIKHNGGETSTLAHLRDIDASIKENKIIKRGERIGTVGNTGLEAKQPPQLHLQIRGVDKKPVDPMLRLPSMPKG